MNSKQLDCVIELSHTLNFNRAAENLFISQPTLSYQIKTLEDELGFTLFERSGKGATLTLAGKQFCDYLYKMRAEMNQTIDSCRNLNQAYNDVIRIFLPTRSCVYFLTDAIEAFRKTHPDVFVDVTIDLSPSHYANFLQGGFDILFGLKSALTSQNDIIQHKLYDSSLYLVSNFDNPLCQLDKVSIDDLKNSTLIVGHASPKELTRVQHSILETYSINTISSINHDTTLTNIRANRGVCIVPGLLNDFTDEFAWTPFKTDEHIPCVLCTHKDTKKKFVLDFVKLLQQYYKNNKNISL